MTAAAETTAETLPPPAPPGLAAPAGVAFSTSSSAGNAVVSPDRGRVWALRGGWPAVALLALISVAALAVAWRAQQRVHGLEQELVRRQQQSQSESTEATVLAHQAQDATRDTAARMALLEARVAEVAVQRGQLEDLMQSMSRSRDENLLVDIDAGLRVALQQGAITGSAEPLVAALKQADERLARYAQPRLEGVRRAIARDLDKVKAVGVADLPSLGIKLDEAVRMVDELPLLSSAVPRQAGGALGVAPRSTRVATAPPPSLASAAARASASAPASNATPGSSVEAAEAQPGPAADVDPPVETAVAASPTLTVFGQPMPAWLQALDERGASLAERVWAEVRGLVRVTRIDRPDAALMAPENAFFVRENLKLRLLNARLALLSRQYETAQSDLNVAQTSLDRYFDHRSRRTALALDLVRQVEVNAVSARQITVLRPDDTLAALASVSPGTVGR